jgi:hypothetical protein
MYLEVHNYRQKISAVSMLGLRTVILIQYNVWYPGIRSGLFKTF